MFEDFFDTDVIEEVRRNKKTKNEHGLTAKAGKLFILILSAS